MGGTTMSNLVLGGSFHWFRYNRQKQLVGWGRFSNGIPTAALNAILESFFRTGTIYPVWYLGLIDTVNFSGLAGTDTIGSHPGWQEFTGYNEAQRQPWNPSGASNGILTDPIAASFTFTADHTVKGLFVASDNTKGGTAGLLWATGLDDQDQSFLGGEICKVVYTLPAVSS